MAGGNIGTIAIILFFVVMILGGISVIAPEFNDNPMIDNNSVALLSDLSVEYEDNYRAQEAFKTPTNNVTNNSIFGGVDDFARQYLENKAEITEKESTIEKILTLPDLFLKIFGVDDATILIAWNAAVYGLFVFLLGLYAYKAIKTGEVDG